LVGDYLSPEILQPRPYQQYNTTGGGAEYTELDARSLASLHSNQPIGVTEMIKDYINVRQVIPTEVQLEVIYYPFE